MKRWIYWAVLAAGSGLLISLWLTNEFGLVGTVASWPIAFLVGVFYGKLYMRRRNLKQEANQVWTEDNL